MKRRELDQDKLTRLVDLADVAAMSQRMRLAEAQSRETRAQGALDALEERRKTALATLGAPDALGTVGLRASAHWMRWAEEEKRRHQIALAAARAHKEQIRKEAAQSIARHGALKKMRDAG